MSEKKESTRVSHGSLVANNVYPVIDGKADMDNLTSVGIRLDKEGVEKLIKALQVSLEESSKWELLDITGYRDNKNVTVTSYIPAEHR